MECHATANPGVVLREEFDDWAVLFDADTGNAVGLNPVGVAVWKCLDGKHGTRDIVNELVGEFTGAPGSVADEVQAFVDKLVEAGFAGYEVGARLPVQGTAREEI